MIWLFESVDLKVKTYENAQAFLNDYHQDLRGCLLIDVNLPEMSGIELLEQLKPIKKGFSIIMMTGYGDIPMAVRAMKAGASDFILKPFDEEQLLKIIQNYLKENNDQITLSQSDVQMRINSLTKREKEIMHFVVEGKLNKQIAFELDISTSTVEVHRAKVMKKMQVKTLTDLIKINLSHALE